MAALRGLGVRVLVLTVLVALAAVGVTAWLTLRETTRQVDTTAHDHAQVTMAIADEVGDYGRLHGTWEGVPSTVWTIHDRTGLRIRLLSGAGIVVIDTAAGTPATTYSRPDAVVDVRPDLPARTWNDPRFPTSVTNAVVQYRQTILFAACLTRDNLPVRYGSPTALGVPTVEPAQLPPGAQSADGTDPATVVKTCRARATSDIPTIEARLNVCHNDPACADKTFHDLTGEVAPVPLLLYAGEPGTATRIARRPVFAGAALVGLVAIAITLLLTHRVLRPIRSLTAAAGQLARGDLSSRVPVHGHDELTELARTFNRMADSLQSSQEQQRQMIADIAHELRTPLANLRGYLEALRDGVLVPDGELLESLHEEALLQQRIVDDLQDLALAESGAMVYRPIRLDVEDLLQTCVTAHRAAAESAGVTLLLEAGNGLRVDGDPDRLRQVIGNLLTNALRATPAGGSVRVASTARNGAVTITVSDTGIGMSAAEVSHIFDRFWRADSARARGTGGTGLGMAIAREFVAAHGGTIAVTSQPGRGTVVTVTLPAPA